MTLTHTHAAHDLASPAAFDPEAVRAEFPILSRTVNGRPLAYLDSAASAQKPAVVIDAMTALMRHSYANVHRGLHTLANESTEAFEGARARVAAFLGAGSPDEIVFTRGSTEAINLVAAGLSHTIEPGDEIILSDAEHHSNIVPWHFLRERKGAVLRWLPVRDDGSIDLDGLDEMVGPRTRLIAITHVSNVTGQATDLARVVSSARAGGDVRVLVDGSQGAVHVPRLNVVEMGVDYYVCTGHKLYGPTGIGALYGRAERLAALAPYQGGGEMIASVSRETVTYASAPHKFEAGTPAIVEAAGLGAALEWLSALDRDAVAAHEARLGRHIADGLRARGATLIGGAGAIVTFHTPIAHAHDIAQILDHCGVAVRAGQHCAEPLMRRFGVVSSCRASLAAYNTSADVDAFFAAYDKALAMLG